MNTAVIYPSLAWENTVVMSVERLLAPTGAYRSFIRVGLIFILVQTVTRLILLSSSPVELSDWFKILAIGFIRDLSAWSILGMPFLLASAFLYHRINRYLNHALVKFSFYFFITFVLSFVAFCEHTFWKEFHSRFNFIAVDYLIYTNEVVANINESFPMGIIIPLLALISVAISWAVSRLRVPVTETPILQKFPSLLLFTVVAPVLLFYFICPAMEYSEKNFRKDQLARNGWVEFYRALRSNQIDFNSFYRTIDPAIAKNIVTGRSASVRAPVAVNFAQRLNVVLIVVESLGAKFIAPLGGQRSTTPNLNQLVNDSLFFENLYATGTRTVRGLEALNLSIPPTPGYAVVKRPDNKNLFSLGHTFKTNGYDPIFLYGGRGFFDNMNSFFEGNGFRTIDQTDFSSSEVTFSNAWGVCDEDLFNKALHVMDKGIGPKLLFVLTTSNHRPFTYPDGKIDVPSGESRAGAVKYTDYAIGKFLSDAQKRPWMKDTIFVIVADHSTEGRGRFSLDMTDFHIPMWIYSPGHIHAARNKKLLSQIDILPSLIHLLGLQDNSPFFGKSFFDANNNDERAFIGNYQFVGYFKDNVLTTLGPNKIVRSYSYDPKTKKQKDLNQTPFLNEAIAHFQYANELLTGGKYHFIPEQVGLLK